MIEIDWKETTIRDFKVCDDMSLTSVNDGYNLIVVENGKIVRRERPSASCGRLLIMEHNLYPVDSVIKNRSIYRTLKSNALVAALLLVGEANMAAQPDPTASLDSSIIHGVDCEKHPHETGHHEHDENDDEPYNVDGCWYCGRCHHCL